MLKYVVEIFPHPHPLGFEDDPRVRKKIFDFNIPTI